MTKVKKATKGTGGAKGAKAGKAGRAAPLSRPPLARMMRIHDELKSGRHPNATSLAGLLEVTTKTIHRDIEFMRSQLNLPVTWEPAFNGYVYDGEVGSFPTVQVTEQELFALLVAEKAVAQYRGTPFETPLRAALEKLSAGLRDTTFYSLDMLDVPISFRPLGEAINDLEVFQMITRAVSQELSLTFQYKKLGDRQYRLRKLEPWHLVCVENKWYVVGHDLDRQAKRTFALVRMQDVRLTGRSFKRPKDFDIRAHLKQAFGIFTGTETHKVRVRFDAFAARLIRETSWHPAQQIIDLEDDAIEFRVTLSDLWEVERWILSWGSHAKVIAPAALRKRVKAHAAAIIAD